VRVESALDMLEALQRSRVLAASILALFALGWLADRAHVAFEPHAWCHEHQRVEHAPADSPACSGDARAAGPACAHDPAPQACADRGPAFEPADAGGDDHASCCVLLARGGDPVALIPDRAPAPLPPGAEPSPRAASDRRVPTPQVPLVLLAPKQSPPAA
jgi:hypothetical protein